LARCGRVIEIHKHLRDLGYRPNAERLNNPFHQVKIVVPPVTAALALVLVNPSPVRVDRTPQRPKAAEDRSAVHHLIRVNVLRPPKFSPVKLFLSENNPVRPTINGRPRVCPDYFVEVVRVMKIPRPAVSKLDLRPDDEHLSKPRHRTRIPGIISIQVGDERPSRNLKPVVTGLPFNVGPSAVSRISEYLDPSVNGAIVINYFRRAIGRCVIYDDQLKVGKSLSEYALD